MLRMFLGVVLLSPMVVMARAQTEPVPAQLEDQKLKFYYSSIRSAYACSYMEVQTLLILEALGAQNIDVRCTGGLPYSDYLNATIKFKSLASTTAATSELVGKRTYKELNFDESCDFNERLTRRLLKGFEVYKTKTRGSCRDSQGNITFKVELLN